MKKKSGQIVKSLFRVLKKHGGRDASGRISIRHQGGGAKRKFRLISCLDEYLDQPGRVRDIQYDPNRTADIALVQMPQDKKIYILAPDGLKVGDSVMAAEKTDLKIGNRMKLKNIPNGVAIHNIALQPGKYGQIVLSAGSSAKITARDDKYVHIKLPSGEIRKVFSECYASVGIVSNITHSRRKFYKAGQTRWRGIRPTVRGKAMHPAAHPHGGGEGVNPIGLKHPKTPWGKPALGVKTRRRKISNKFIIKRRGK